MASVLITGASRGIGQATAIELARRGHSVFACVRSAEAAGRLGQAAERAGAALEPVHLDVTEATAAADVAGVIERHGSLDVLIQNAGVASCEPSELIEERNLRLAFDTNVIGPILIAQPALQFFRSVGSGRLITISSLTRRALLSGPLNAVYAATKASIDAWAVNLNKEVAEFGIRSVVVELGGFATDMMDGLRSSAEHSTPLGSGYERAGQHFAESMQRLSSSLPPPEAAARGIANVVEDPNPPLRTILPPQLSVLADRVESLGDEDFWAVCGAGSYRDSAHALRAALSRGT